MATVMDWINAKNKADNSWTKLKIKKLMNKVKDLKTKHNNDVIDLIVYEKEKRKAWEAINNLGGYDALEDE